MADPCLLKFISFRHESMFQVETQRLYLSMQVNRGQGPGWQGIQDLQNMAQNQGSQTLSPSFKAYRHPLYFEPAGGDPVTRTGHYLTVQYSSEMNRNAFVFIEFLLGGHPLFLHKYHPPQLEQFFQKVSLLHPDDRCLSLHAPKVVPLFGSMAVSSTYR